MKWCTLMKVLGLEERKPPKELVARLEEAAKKESDLIDKMAARGLLDGYRELDKRYEKNRD